jgi:hypothetical protein
MRSIFDFKPQFKRYRIETPWGDINDEDGGGVGADVGNLMFGNAMGGVGGALTMVGVGRSTGFDITDPFGTNAALQQQQNMLNEYRIQQERLMRDEQNRRWQEEISSSWAAYGAQRRSQITTGSGGRSSGTLGAMSANDLYLGGR